MIKYSPAGAQYLLNQVNESQTEIVSADIKSIIVNVPIEIIDAGWDAWVKGKLIQYAFPMLTSSQREFIKTGLTDAEWHAIFYGAND